MRRLSLLLTTLFATAALGGGVATAAPNQRTLQSRLEAARPAHAPAADAAVPNRLIVVFDSDAGPSDRQDTRADAGATVVRALGAKAFQLLRPASGRTVTEAIAALRADPDVRSAERDLVLQPAAVPNDPLFGQQWGLRNLGLGVNGGGASVSGDDIDVLSAWDHTVGTPSTIVADIDSGYRDDNPDLASVETPGRDFVDDDSDPTDDDLVGGGHGVHTAGIIGAAGNNGIGVTGVAQNVRIMPLRVCSHAQSCPFSAITDAINYAGQHGARVANLSLGGPQSTTIDNAIAANPQVLFVIAAGNGNPNTGLGVDNDGGSPYRSYPCINTPAPGAVDNVVCVAATTQSDGLARFSNWGRTSVDLGAPGTDILSTYPSFATPLFSDDFESNDFGTRWTTSSPGFSRTNESPLTSFGIANSPIGSAQLTGTTRSAASTAVTVPATSTCRVSLDVKANMKDGHSFAFGPMQGSSFVDPGPPLEGPISGSGRLEWDFDVPAGATEVGLEYSIPSSGSSQSDAGDGIHVDNVVFNCIAPVGQTTGTAFLDGTSMATPMVSGAAALLFSQVPSATVTQVRNAILQNTDPVSALATTTVSGGRLDAGKAMTALIGQPVIATPPASPPATPPATMITTPVIPLPIVKPVVRCVVPKLSGRTLAGATAALKRAHCRVGKVTKPRHGKRLRVKSSNPRAGTRRTASTKVALVLASTRVKR